MRVQGVIFATLGVLLILQPQLDADEPDAKALAKRAKLLWKRYQTERKKPRSVLDRDGMTRRLSLVAEFGDIRTQKAAEFALEILKTDPELCVRLAAMTSIARVGDLAVLKKAVRYISGQKKTVLPEMLWESLATSKDNAVGAWLATEALPKATPRIRLSLVQALGALKAEEARAPLVRLYEKYANKSKDVVLVYEVVRALGQIGGPEAEPVLLAAAAHKDWRIRAAAADVLVPKPDSAPEVIAVMRRLLADPNALVAQRAARSVGAGRARALVPSLLLLLESNLLKTRKFASDALQAMSGRDLGLDVSAWKRWWRAAQGNSVEDADTKAVKGRMTVATYHGIKVFSNRIVFVIDVSGSMRLPEHGPNRLDVARKELVRVIRTLTPPTSFNILIFAGSVRSWKKREAVATDANLKAATRWVEKKLHHGGNTDTYRALLAALDASRNVDTVYLLSDGEPSHGEHTEGAVIVNRFADANRFRGVTVNTISLLLNDEFREDDSDRFSDATVSRIESFLRNLAERTGGTFRAVNKYPPGWKR